MEEGERGGVLEKVWQLGGGRAEAESESCGWGGGGGWEERECGGLKSEGVVGW